MLKKSKLKTLLLAVFALFIASSLIAFPNTSVDAALDGLKMWWNIVFPSLLPFFIISELLIGFGIVTFIGVLLEPVMRPIFKVPGVGAFVFAMGICSGFPAGAKITARLYEEDKLTKVEAERLASFTNFSNPLFMFGVIAVGFFHKASLGIVFALAHYIGNIGVGLLMRFYKQNVQEEKKQVNLSPYILVNAFRSMHRERIKNKRPIGKMLGDAVQNSVSTLLMVGGFIILFSVFNRLLQEMGGTEVIALLFKHLLVLLSMSADLGSAIVPGLFEITVGAKSVSEMQVPLIEAVIVVSFILGFGGFSIQAQVASILAEAKLNAKPFFIGRIFHGLFSAIAAGLLYHWFSIKESAEKTNAAIPVMHPVWQGLHRIQFLGMDSMQWGSIITLMTLIFYIFFQAFRHHRQSI
ncbi:MAG: sporulation integral membrane protein YlbJ [Tuberibacillus sp.]